MKREWKKLAVTGLAAVMAAGVISGCGKKATPENLLKDMAKNAESVESVFYNMAMKASMGDGTDSMGISLDLDMENTKEPEAAHGKGRIDIEMSGTSIGTEMELYQVEEDGSPVVYMMTENKWVKLPGDESESMADDEMFGDMEDLADRFTVSDELTDVNGEACFELKGDIGGEEFADTFSGVIQENALGAVGLGNSLDIDESTFSDAEIPCTIDIYKDSILPARIYLELSDVSGRLMGEMAEQLTESEFYVEITYMEYDSTEAIKVPEDVAAEAGGADGGQSGTTGNIFGFGGGSGGDVTASAKPAAQSSELGGSWESFTVQVNDKVLTLPCSVSDLEAAGLSLDTEYTPKDYIVNAQEYELAWFRDANGNELMADLINMGTEAKTIKECLVGGISVDEFAVESGGLTVILPGGVQIGTELEDVTAVYGQADDVYEGEYVDMYSWYGEDSYYDGCQIDIDSETGLVSSMGIDHYQ